jgi:hypothetical protein
MGTDDAVTTSSSGAARTAVDRRAFLRRTVAGLGASALMSMPAVQHAEAATRKKVKTAYRLSTHGRRECSACKIHAAKRFYISADIANTDRAHRGCNCGIVTQDLPQSLWSCYFRRGKAKVYDLRWRRPSCPPP